MDCYQRRGNVPVEMERVDSGRLNPDQADQADEADEAEELQLKVLSV